MAEFFIPAERIIPLVEKLVEERNYVFTGDEMVGGISALEADTGINQRLIGNLLRRNQPSVAFETVDRLLVRTGNYNLWHTPPERGGLADFYVAESPYVRERKKASVRRKAPRLCECGSPLHRKTKGNLCGVCYVASIGNPNLCADCGAKVNKASLRCRPCHFAFRTKTKAPEASKEWISSTGRIINKWAYLEKKDKTWNHS